jgi:hypothetical protein
VSATQWKTPTLADCNKTVAEALVDASNAISDRARFTTLKATGLKPQFQQAEAAVASQVGRRSAEYKTVSGIGY